jgi:lipopolysaccharide export system permease protein
MYLLDRLLFRSYLKSYFICLISLLTLYVVVDLFTNLDDYTENHDSLRAVLQHIGVYYGYQISKIFNSLSEVIVLLAASFTVALVQRNNELLPLLSAGVPTRRVVLPILLGGVATLALGVVNQEVIIAHIGRNLMNDRDDPNGEKDIIAQVGFEPNGILLEGRIASRKGLVVKPFFVNIPEKIAGCSLELSAQEARYLPPVEGQPRSGGWLLTGTHPETLDSFHHPDLEMIDPGKYFLRTRNVDFDSITRSRTWFVYASTYRLWEELSRPDSIRLASMAVMFHMRLTRPLLGMILVVIGLSIILRDQNRNVFISAGLCLVLCGLFFAVQFACKGLGDHEYLSPALAAWLPVLFFGPFGFDMFDAIHT